MADDGSGAGNGDLVASYTGRLKSLGIDSISGVATDSVFHNIVPVRGEEVLDHIVATARLIVGERGSRGLELAECFVEHAPKVYRVLSPESVDRWVSRGLNLLVSDGGTGSVDPAAARAYFSLLGDGNEYLVELHRLQEQERADSSNSVGLDYGMSKSGYRLAAGVLLVTTVLASGAAAVFYTHAPGNVARDLEDEVGDLSFQLKVAREESGRKHTEFTQLERSYARAEAEWKATHEETVESYEDMLWDLEESQARDTYRRISEAREKGDVEGLYAAMDDFNLLFGEPYKDEGREARMVAYHRNDCQAAAEWYANLLLGEQGMFDAETSQWVVANTLPLCANVDPKDPSIIFLTYLEGVE